MGRGRSVALRRAAAPVVTLSLLAALAACTEDDPPATDPPDSDTATPTPTAEPEPVRLRIHVHGDRRQLEAYRGITERYALAHPEVRIELETARDAAVAAERVATSLEAGAGPDVFLLDEVHLPGFVTAGALQPVDALLEEREVHFGDDYQRVALNAFGVEDALQCMPAETSPLVLHVSTPLLRQVRRSDLEVDLPTREDEGWAWEDFVLTARAMADSDGTGPVKGVALPSDLETMTALVRSAGADVVDDVLEPTSLVLTSDDALTAIGEVLAVQRDATLSPTPRELADEDPVSLFRAGLLGMYVGTRADVPLLRQEDGLRFTTLPLPSLGRSESVARIQGLCIGEDAEDVDAAADFIAYAVGSEGATVAARSAAIVPSHLPTLSAAAFLQPAFQPKHAAAYLASVRRADPMPYSAAWPDVEQLAGEVFARLARKPVLDETVLEDRMARLDEASTELFATASPPE